MDKNTQIAAEILATGITTLGLAIPNSCQHDMLLFLKLLQQWNRSYNLTAITELKQMVVHHLLDSLAIANQLEGECILDVGSGAGFPGIPLAWAYPDKRFVLLDSRGKKTRFLLQAVSTYKLTNVAVVQSRVENFNPSYCFDAIICRALGTLAEVVAQTAHIMCAQGRWLLMKGKYPQPELAALRLPATVVALQIPGLTAQRHVVVIEKASRISSD